MSSLNDHDYPLLPVADRLQVSQLAVRRHQTWPIGGINFFFFFFTSTSQTEYLFPCFAPQMVLLGFFVETKFSHNLYDLPLYDSIRIRTHVSKLWGTLIQKALPTDLLRPRLGGIKIPAVDWIWTCDFGIPCSTTSATATDIQVKAGQWRRHHRCRKVETLNASFGGKKQK